VFGWRLSAVPVLALAAQEPRACRGPAELEQIIASHPSAGAYDALGAYFGQRRQFPCAFTAFELALRLEPNSWEARYNLALALLESGNAERALRELRVAARLRPATPLTHTTLGMALGELGRTRCGDRRIPDSSQIRSKIGSGARWTNKSAYRSKRYTAAISRLKNAPARRGAAIESSHRLFKKRRPSRGRANAYRRW